jgi:hypothetical protein
MSAPLVSTQVFYTIGILEELFEAREKRPEKRMISIQASHSSPTNSSPEEAKNPIKTRVSDLCRN